MHRAKQQSVYRFDLSGGALCLDFANTVSHRHLRERRAEHLSSYADLVGFGEQSNLIPPKLAARLRSRADRCFPKHKGLWQIHRSSGGLYRAFAALAAGKHARPADIHQINDFTLEALQHRTLARTNGEYRWEWRSDGGNLERILWPIAESAVNLLSSEDRAAIRECERPIASGFSSTTAAMAVAAGVT